MNLNIPSMVLSVETIDAENKIETLIDYMKSKIEERDFHAVSDAANDVRELEERIRVYKKLRAEYA